MSQVVLALVGGSAGAAIIKMLDHLLQHYLRQKDKKKARREESGEERLKKLEDWMQQNNDGTVALLHDRLYQSCNSYIERKWVTMEDLRNLEYMYKPYHALGGNDVCTELVRRCREELDIHSTGQTG